MVRNHQSFDLGITHGRFTILDHPLNIVSVVNVLGDLVFKKNSAVFSHNSPSIRMTHKPVGARKIISIFS